MKSLVFISLFALLLLSCARWRSGGETKCIKVEAVPSELLNSASTKTSDSSTRLSIQLSATEEEPDFEYVWYKINSSSDSTHIGQFDGNGFIDLEVPEGTYWIMIKTLGLTNFELDSIIVSPNFQTHLDVKMGTPEMYMTVQTR